MSSIFGESLNNISTAETIYSEIGVTAISLTEDLVFNKCRIQTIVVNIIENPSRFISIYKVRSSLIANFPPKLYGNISNIVLPNHKNAPC